MFSKSLDRKVGKLNNPDGGLVFQGSLKSLYETKMPLFQSRSRVAPINILSSTKTLTEQRASIHFLKVNSELHHFPV